MIIPDIIGVRKVVSKTFCQLFEIFASVLIFILGAQFIADLDYFHIGRQNFSKFSVKKYN